MRASVEQKEPIKIRPSAMKIYIHAALSWRPLLLIWPLIVQYPLRHRHPLPPPFVAALSVRLVPLPELSPSVFLRLAGD